MKMSFTPDSLTVNAILKHQEKAKAANERHTRSDAINDLISHGDTLETLWHQYGDDIKAATLAAGGESTLGYILDAVLEKMQHDGYTPHRRFLEIPHRKQVIFPQQRSPGRPLQRPAGGYFYLFSISHKSSTRQLLFRFSSVE